ncbi:hypothetical protein [Cyanobium sp. AMD-g]|uniref:hypothetical protein n=1 Tax=Cyanobium sp. AMD-g TaxID=2823699 RepID=UPI0020CFE0EA|nr:hypothetical protein [Cyanobium sp. AMD-g]
MIAIQFDHHIRGVTGQKTVSPFRLHQFLLHRKAMGRLPPETAEQTVGKEQADLGRVPGALATMVGNVKASNNNSLPLFQDLQAMGKQGTGRLDIQQTDTKHPARRAAVHGAGRAVGVHTDKVDDGAGGAFLGHQKQKGIRQGLEDRLAAGPGRRAGFYRSLTSEP